MAAGIVASTLRRKAFHKRALHESTRYQAIEPGHIGGVLANSPTDDGPGAGAWRTSSIVRVESPPSAAAARTPVSQLSFKDFWPSCLNAAVDTNLYQLEFETFDNLIPKANAWLLENVGVGLIKCETIEKKISSVDEINTDNVLFAPSDGRAVFVKGLRLWFLSTVGVARGATTEAVPSEIGYMNVIPKCIDCSGKYPHYENLPETYSAINVYLSANPLEGKILTIETVALKLPKKQWKGPEINPDQTCFHDEYMRHLLYITRIYFHYGLPQPELIGAQDFLPDFEHSLQWQTVYMSQPKYSPLFSAMRKVKEWMQTARHIAVTNIQTLHAVYRKRPGTVHTGVNFIEKSESCAMVRFVRVTYVRHSSCSNGTADVIDSRTSTSPPTGFSYKTFVPAPVTVGMCSGTPNYERFSSTWDRAKAWLKLVDRRVIGVETFYHPLHRVWNDQDGGESTVMDGDWTTSTRTDRVHRHRRRRQLVSIVRVYLDGDYREPPAHLVPPPPVVEEINDCTCVVM